MLNSPITFHLLLIQGLLVKGITDKFGQGNTEMLIYQRLKYFKKYSQNQWYNDVIL